MSHLIRDTIPVSAPFAPYSEKDTHATHISTYGKGGYHEVSSIAERNNIPDSRRTIGMMAYVSDEGNIYVLKNGISNLNWTDLNLILSSNDTLSQIYVSFFEPEIINSNTLWLDRNSGDLKYRDSNNSMWLLLNEKHSIDFGLF